MKFKLIILFSIICFFEVNITAGNNEVFQIIKDYKRPNIKRSVDVRIQKRISTTQLKSIAMQIKESDRQSYSRTFILYWLPNQVVDSGAWATTHFNPELEVRILELSLEEYENLVKSAIKITKNELIGQWYEYFSSRIVTIYKKGKKVVLHFQYNDGSNSETEVKLTHTKQGIRIDEIKGNSFYKGTKIGDLIFDTMTNIARGEFYLVNKNNYLESWDSDGFTEKCEPLKN